MDSSLTYWLEAYQWLCYSRRHASVNADVWDVRFHWETQWQDVYRHVLSGNYHLSPLQIIGRPGKELAIWRAWDALVLKWVALQVKGAMPVHTRCEHGIGHRGGRSSLSRVQAALKNGEFQYVFRTDIRGYYRHIVKVQVVNQFNRCIDDVVLQKLFYQYVYYSVESGGEFHTPEKGISRGCALSPLVGASLLFHVDSHFSSQDEVFYARYMDDFLIFTRTRWKLRKSVRRLNEFFDLSGFEQHPDKTFLGRLEKGFDWLGVQFNHSGATGISPRSLINHQERCLRLYEQARARRCTEEASRMRVQAYVRRWAQWAESVLRDTGVPPVELKK